MLEKKYQIINSSEEEAHLALKSVLDNNNAEFKPGQLEAIMALVNGGRVLLIQATGWGKSAVYWTSTKLLRDRGKGLTVVVSPLLSLMRDQAHNAEQGGLNVAVLNSSIDDVEVKNNVAKIKADEIDVLLLSPERLNRKDFISDILDPLIDNNKIGLFVIDEAHCISEWGHDFRPKFRRIAGLVGRLPDATPVLATTATANFRVIRDIQEQVAGLHLMRGSLLRESLSLQCIGIPDKISRLAWLADNIPLLPGSGIIYCLTVADVNFVAKWLRKNGIAAEAYYGSVNNEQYPDSNDCRVFLEQQLLGNKLKVLVSTNALGMGFDKPDLGFVIHHNMPGCLIGYYQQAGRAGRKLDLAYAILFYGSEDDEVNEYFIENALPDKRDVESVLESLEKNQGLKVAELERNVNLPQGKLRDILNILEVMDQPPVRKDGSTWYRTDHSLVYGEKVEFLISRRKYEWKEVQKYFHNQSECRMSFLRRVLDDNNIVSCGKCDVCNPEARLPDTITRAAHAKAIEFVSGLQEGEIKPRQRVPVGALSKLGLESLKRYQHQPGRYLYRLQASEVEALVNNKAGRLRLVDIIADYYQNSYNPKPQPTWMTYIPSGSWSDSIHQIAKGVAGKLGLELRIVFSKEAGQQKISDFNNSPFKCHYIDDHYKLVETPKRGAAVLLFDLLHNSGWSIAVLTALLRKSGSGQVFPLALASSSKA